VGYGISMSFMEEKHLPYGFARGPETLPPRPRYEVGPVDCGGMSSGLSDLVLDLECDEGSGIR
jgi:hypothetical protein